MHHAVLKPNPEAFCRSLSELAGMLWNLRCDFRTEQKYNLGRLVLAPETAFQIVLTTLVSIICVTIAPESPA